MAESTIAGVEASGFIVMACSLFVLLLAVPVAAWLGTHNDQQFRRSMLLAVGAMVALLGLAVFLVGVTLG